MALPSAVYLRATDGTTVGPLPTQWLELLFDAGVVTDHTPVSLNGQRWRAIGDWREMADRLHEVQAQIASGSNPWPIVLSKEAALEGDVRRALGRTPSAPVAYATASTEPARRAEPSSSSIPIPERTADLSSPSMTIDTAIVPEEEAQNLEGPPLRAWVNLAIRKVTGTLTVEHETGPITLNLRGGRIATLDVKDPTLALAAYLVEAGVTTEAALQVAAAEVARKGLDLGSALVMTGGAAPDPYFDTYKKWARRVLSLVVLSVAEKVTFHSGDISSPAVPLGFDRYGIFMEVIREIPRSTLSELLESHRTQPLIISGVEGLRVENLKLQPKELRTIKQINGRYTLRDLLDQIGSDESASASVLRSLFFATRTGLAFWGEDPLLKEELAEAGRLRDEYEKIKNLDHFKVLGVKMDDDDDAVRAGYTALAKRFHTDALRPDADPGLREIREQLFSLISQAFAAIETEGRRERYRKELEEGVSREETNRAQAILFSESIFKKAEVLMRVRKYDEALKFLDEALNLNPDEVEFQVVRTYCKLLLDQGSRPEPEPAFLAEAIDSLKAAVQKRPEMLNGHLILAQLSKMSGDNKLMVRSYQKVLDLDPKHAEAGREIRLERLRREKEKEKSKKRWF